jgi:CRP-like cAMP-binding protein
MVIIKITLSNVYFDIQFSIPFEGAHGDTFYIISEGTVEVSIVKENAETEILREMSKGNYFGEMALLSESDDKRTATVKCQTRVSCYTLDREPFRKLIGNVAEKVIFGSCICKNCLEK